MDPTTKGVTEEDLLKAMQEALRQAEEAGAGALTAAEMVQALGVSVKRVYAAMDALGDKIECIEVRRANRANRISVVPAYRLKQTQGGSHEYQDHSQRAGPGRDE
jgi:hypothetical protein